MRLAPFALLMAVGCAADPDRFLPANARGTSAYYELERDGRNWGDVKVSSPSAGDAPVFEVDFRVRNDGEQPVEFDVSAAYLELNLDGRSARARPANPGQPQPVPAGSVRDIRISFPLPEDVDVGDIEEAEVNWAIRTPNGRMTHSTVFLPYYEEDDLRYYPRVGLGFGYGHYHRPWGFYGSWYDPFWP